MDRETDRDGSEERKRPVLPGSTLLGLQLA